MHETKNYPAQHKNFPADSVESRNLQKEYRESDVVSNTRNEHPHTDAHSL